MQLSRPSDIRWGRFALELSRRTHIMGVLNITPDSFSDGGRYMGEDAACRHAVSMAAAGADIIDVGGESTRPGAEDVRAAIEMERVLPVIRRLARELDIPISIDTRKAEVASAALANGAAMINDVSGLGYDKGMAGVVASAGVPVVVMHMHGTPRTMQIDTSYGDVVKEAVEYLRGSVRAAEAAGVDAGKIIVDPGIGFGKTAVQNLEIIRRLSEFTVLERPILIGVSRKSFIGAVLRDVHGGGTVPGTEERVFGTTAACALAIANGASIIRVHDVKEMADVARVADAVIRR